MKLTVDYKKRKQEFVIRLDAEAMEKLEMATVLACNRAHENINEQGEALHQQWARNYYRGFVSFTTPIREAFFRHMREAKK
jgi:hypothetical protein